MEAGNISNVNAFLFLTKMLKTIQINLVLIVAFIKCSVFLTTSLKKCVNLFV